MTEIDDIEFVQHLVGDSEVFANIDRRGQILYGYCSSLRCRAKAAKNALKIGYIRKITRRYPYRKAPKTCPDCGHYLYYCRDRTPSYAPNP